MPIRRASTGYGSAAAMRKLNVTSVAALVRYAIRNRLVEP